MGKLSLSRITSGYNSTSRINEAFSRLEAALDNTLSRDGSTPNTMNSRLDMNSNRIINLGSPAAGTDAARWADVIDALAISTALPSQTGNAGRVIQTDGSILSWADPLSRFAQTATEASNSITPTAYGYVAGDIRRYGAVDGSGDCTAAFTTAMVASKHVYVPPGSWRVDSQVTVTLDRTIHLDSGAVVSRQSAFSAATTPVFWLGWSQGSILGSGIGSQVKSENAHLSGVILIGETSMTSNQGRDILYCSVSNLLVRGSTNYGATSGAGNACIKIINPQLSSYASYFHRLDNLVLNAANYGLHLQGWANGLQMSNIHGYWLGNVTRGTGVGADAMIYSQGALDNSCVNVFHHFSPDTPTLRFEDLDNTATSGGSLHVSSYNSYTNIVCEQGGSSCYAVVMNAGCTAFKNKIQIVDNVALGYDVSTARLAVNSFEFTSTGISAEDLQVRDTLTVTGVTTLNGRAKFKQRCDTVVSPTYSASITIDASTGNFQSITVTNTSAFTINAPTNPSSGQIMTIQIGNFSGGTMGTITWNATFKMSTWTNPAAGFSRYITFIYNGVNWAQISQAGIDITN